MPNVQPKNPEESVQEVEYDLDYHFKRKNVNKDIKDLFEELDKRVREIDESIWVKFAQTAITYYSPEKTFVYLTLRKSSLALDIYTGQKTIGDRATVDELVEADHSIVWFYIPKIARWNNILEKSAGKRWRTKFSFNFF